MLLLSISAGAWLAPSRPARQVIGMKDISPEIGEAVRDGRSGLT